jgi:hypothetical protein
MRPAAAYTRKTTISSNSTFVSSPHSYRTWPRHSLRNRVVFASFLRFQRTQECPNRSKTREDTKLSLNLADLHSFSPRSYRASSRHLLRNRVLFPLFLRLLRTKNRSKRSSIREDIKISYIVTFPHFRSLLYLIKHHRNLPNLY